MDILDKIKQAGLVGRGGACFPTGQKWQMVKEASGKKKYVVCNASEGEPGVTKDFFILENYTDKVIDGIETAREFLIAAKGYIFLNHKYQKKLKNKLEKAIGDKQIEIFIKPINSGYIGGEESAILNAIEGRRIEPRLRPPFPVTRGLWGGPTLINNVETLYNVSLVKSGDYRGTRFYTINGDCLHAGVYEYPENWTIEKILKKSDNLPAFSFFVQVGGDGSGEVFNSRQLKRTAGGTAAITVYSMAKYKPLDLIKGWLNFFLEESCGQCTPCREGVYRLLEMIKSSDPDWSLFRDLLDNLTATSFCGLGCVVPVPIKTYVKNVLNSSEINKIKINGLNKEAICKCFS